MVSLEESDRSKKQGRWTDEEQRLFANAVKIYGKRWKKLEQVIGTRTSTQCRSHGQKYFLKLRQSDSQGKPEYKLEADSTQSEGGQSETTGKETVSVEEMDNNQLREHLQHLLSINLQLSKEINRLKADPDDSPPPSILVPKPIKHPCTQSPSRIPAKTAELKVIFQDVHPSNPQ